MAGTAEVTVATLFSPSPARFLTRFVADHDEDGKINDDKTNIEKRRVEYVADGV